MYVYNLCTMVSSTEPLTSLIPFTHITKNYHLVGNTAFKICSDMNKMTRKNKLRLENNGDEMILNNNNNKKKINQKIYTYNEGNGIRAQTEQPESSSWAVACCCQVGLVSALLLRHCSSSSSWPMKLRLGDIMERAAFTSL